MNITWIGSPNFDSNRTDISRIVIHWFGMGTLAGADATFQKPSGTSAHYAISDNIIHQYVKEENTAYHAGNYAVNQRSIGLEHDANPDKPLSEQSYQTSAKLIAEICLRYNIPIDRQHIIKHSEVKATQCPGTIDLDKLIKLAKGITMPDALQECLAQHTKLVDEATAKDKEIFLLKESVRELEAEIERLKLEITNPQPPENPPNEAVQYSPTGKIENIYDGDRLIRSVSYEVKRT